ncbi:MAG: DUF4124 domain-containing protein [Gammaproteobacteria bacterium]|nr:DUF4124 domain-containing protein [Gammaproteobacteria bacterium]MBU1624516.1 DUF4124 domain-containing protein [Gammaproteobacteria bacterium]MBU1982360.1 DUF4124 domain-containing protein [Gammaproteobacteria bacterium]
MKPTRMLLLCAVFTASTAAHAEIYKRVDKEGRVTYSSEPIRGAQKLQLEPLPTVPPPRTVAKERNRESDEAAFPRVDKETQKRRDDKRLRILEDEMTSEQQALEEARTQLKVAEDTPQVYRAANGQTYRNMAKYEETVQAAQENVRMHENNVRAIQTEIDNLK